MKHLPAISSRPLLALGFRFALVVVAAALLAAGIWWDNAANRGIAAAPPRQQIRWADVPRAGVNAVGLNQEVVTPAQRRSGDNKVARTFQMIRAAGFHFVRVQFPWEDIEVCGKGVFVDCRGASAGQSTWAKYDYIVQQARANGLELIVRLDRPPGWARRAAIASPEAQAQQGKADVTGPPDRLEDYADFVGAVAARYRSDLRFYQIWNEPNLPGEWNYRRLNPADFVYLLRMAGAAIKRRDPDAAILFPALSPTDGADRVAVNDLEYLQGIYDAGGRDAFDIMSAQFYGLGQPPDEHRYVGRGKSLLRPIETRADVSRVVLLREIMERNGDAAKAVWISELGWNSAPPGLPHPWGASVTEEQKARYLVGAMERARREWPWMGPMNIWMFRWGGEKPNPANPTPYFAIVGWDFQPLPAYRAVADYLANPPTSPPVTGSALAALAPVLPLLGVILAAAAFWPAFARLVAAAGLALGTSVATRVRRLRHPSGRLGRPVRHLTSALPRRDDPRVTRAAALLLVLGLIIFYRASPQLPLTLVGGLLVVGAALARPDFALMAVIATVPLYLAPKGVWDKRFGLSRPEGYFLPLHEFVLMAGALGALPYLWRQAKQLLMPGLAPRADGLSTEGGRRFRLPPPLGGWGVRLLLCFLFVGTLGVAVAGRAGRSTALREWRWLIVEPLIFYALVRFFGPDAGFRRRLLSTWLLTGVVIAVIGLIQLTGLDLAGLLRGPCPFSEAVVQSGGVRRATSVYCHPNNLGLALGRVWPVWAALALGALATTGHRHVFRSLRGQSPTPNPQPPTPNPQPPTPTIVCTLLVLAGIGASFSKGAFLGVFGALVVLGIVLRRRLLLALAGLSVVAAITFGAVFGLDRLNPLGGSSGARLELWGSAVAMLRDHPFFGVGLDQFYRLRSQDGPGPYLSVEASQTSERFASHPHNLVLDILLRIGPLGLLVMAALLARFFRRARFILSRSSRDDHWLIAGLLAAMIAGLIHGLVDNFYFVPDLALVFWLQLALVDLLYKEVYPRLHVEERILPEETMAATPSAP